MLLKNINLSLRYYIVLSSLLLLSYYGELTEKICAIWAFLYVFFFFNCVDSLSAYHNGAIIATLSKNDVFFDVGDKCSYSNALLREQNATNFIHVSILLFAFMLLVLFWLD